MIAAIIYRWAVEHTKERKKQVERIDIIDAVGREYHTANIENGEFSYPKAFKEKNLDFRPIQKKKGKGSW